MSTPTTFEIDDERTRFKVRFSPRLPGFKVAISGIRGTFTIPLLPDGSPDLDAKSEGDFAAGVEGLSLGNPVLSRLAHKWLDDGTDAPIRGSLGESRPTGDPDGSQVLTLVLVLRGNPHELESVGRVVHRGEELVVEGTTTVRPEDVGFPFPLPLPMKACSSYEITLVRAPT